MQKQLLSGKRGENGKWSAQLNEEGRKNDGKKVIAGKAGKTIVLVREMSQPKVTHLNRKKEEGPYKVEKMPGLPI